MEVTIVHLPTGYLVEVPIRTGPIRLGVICHLATALRHVAEKKSSSTPQTAKESTMSEEIEEELTTEQKEAAEKKEFMLGRIPYSLISNARVLLGLEPLTPWDKTSDSTRKTWREAARLADMHSMGIWLNAHDPDAVAAYWEYTELIGERYEKTSEQYIIARKTYENMKKALADSQLSQKRG
jgi:hypothetical protein